MFGVGVRRRQFVWNAGLVPWGSRGACCTRRAGHTPSVAAGYRSPGAEGIPLLVVLLVSPYRRWWSFILCRQPVGKDGPISSPNP